MSGDRPCGSGRVGDRGAGVYASPPQAPCEVLQKRLFPAEEMGRPGDLEPNAIRAVCRHKRAVAHAPGSEPGEPFVVRLRLRSCAALSAATMTRRGPIFVAITTGFSRGGASAVFFR